MPQLPPCLVIGRPDSERMRACGARLEALDLRAEVSPAVMPEGDPPWGAHYDDTARRRQLGYPMHRGEVGCFLAHRRAWRRILEAGWPVALVLEDDAELDGTRLGAVSDAARAISGRPVVVRLVSDPRTPLRVWRELGGGACLGLPTRPGNLTTAYLVTREAAAALLGASERFCLPVDNFLNQAHQHGVDVLHAEPPPARHGQAASEIGARPKPSVTPWFRLWREGLRAWLKTRSAVGRLGSRARLGLLFRRAVPPR